MKKSLLLKGLAFLLAFAFIFMEYANAQTRVLKRRIEVDKLTSRVISVPGGVNFDFEYAVNAQILDALSNSPYFTTVYHSPLEEQNSYFRRFLDQLPNDVPSCLIDHPEAVITGAVLGFEAANSFGLSIGYSPNGNFQNGAQYSANVKVDRAQLDLILQAYDPLTYTLRASGEALANQTKTNIGVNVNFGNFNIGPQFFFTSPLAKVSRKALDIALEKIAGAMTSTPWSTVVISGLETGDNDTHFRVNAGSRDGLKVGDQLALYGMEHRWNGKPCAKGSTYEGLPIGSGPAVVITIEAVGELISRGKVTWQDPDARPLKRGAKAFIYKLAN